MTTRACLRWLGLTLCVGSLLGCASDKTVGKTSRKQPTGASTAKASGKDSEQISESDLKRIASAHAHYANGVVLEMQNRYSKALAEFKEAASLTPENEAMVWQVSRKLIGAKDPNTALELLERSANRPGASGLAWARLSAIQLQNGELNASIKSGQEAVRRAPAVIEGYHTLFLGYLQSGDLEKARETLTEAETDAPDNPEYLVQLSELFGLLITNEPSDRDELRTHQMALLDRAAALPIDSDLLKMRLADGLLELGRNEQAAALYQNVLQTMPDSPGSREVVRSKLINAYLQGKDPAKAREQLEEVVKRDPTNVQACYFLGTLAYNAKDFETARDYFRRVTVLDPDFEPGYYDLGGVLIDLDRLGEAEEVVDAARHKFPQSFAMEMLSAMIHLRRDEPDKALPHFVTAEITAQAVDPERLTYLFYFQFAVAAEQSGDKTGAERHLKKCLELNPDFAPGQNYLGYMWAEQGINLHESLELIQKAVAVEPDNAAYLDSLGWVLFKLNRNKEALEALLKAVDHLEEPDAVVYEHLGDVYQGLNQQDKAVEMWKKSYGLDPTEAVGEKLQNAGYPVANEEEK